MILRALRARDSCNARNTTRAARRSQHCLRWRSLVNAVNPIE